MALTRKLLGTMGIDDEKVEQIITAHTEVTNALKEERDSYKEKAEQLTEVQKELDELKKSMPEDGKNPYKVKYEALKEEYESYKDGIEKQNIANTKAEKVKAILKEIGVSEKRIASVVKVVDLDSIKLDKEGNIEGVDDLKKNLAEEWDDFIVKTSEKGSDIANPPSQSGKSQMSKEEILKIKDTSERQKAIADNLKLFGG